MLYIMAASALSAIGPGDDSGVVLSAGQLSLKVSADLNYTISVDSEEVFRSNRFAFSNSQGSFGRGEPAEHDEKPLILVAGPLRSNGSDQAGAFDMVTLQWSSVPSGGAEWITTFKAYSSGGAITFEQTWPLGLHGASGSTFPAFEQATHRKLGTLEYTGVSCGFMVSPRSSFPGITGGKSKGYIVIAPKDEDGTGAPYTLAVGPVTEHFVNQASNRGTSLTYGMAASFGAAPPGYAIETALTVATKGASAARAPDRVSVPAGGVNDALFAYGDYVLKRHGKTRAAGDIRTETAYLGYSTTGYYFYNLCDCLEKPVATEKSNGAPDAHNRRTCSKGQSPIPPRYLQGAATPGVCASYADTLIAVNAALAEQKIPIRHFLLDSWWYGEGWNGGAAYWEDVPACTGNDTREEPSAFPADTFPKGLRAFHEAVGTDKAIWAHNGKWTGTTPYRKRFPFVPGGPPQGRLLWDHLFSENHGWGLGTIKQDHMGEQMSGESSFSNVSVLKSWLSGMGAAATDNNVGVLYCCAPPSVHMNGVTVPAAYAVRASPDYVWRGGRSRAPLKLPTVQWATGPDNAFHWNGLGLLPYKDTFISNATSTQKSGGWTDEPQYWPSFKGYHEKNAATHALMSLLSLAHVTFSDPVGESNRTLLMQLIRDDGMLLKPDRPATAIDAQFQAMLFDAWPGTPAGPTPGHGTLFLSACDPTNSQQQFTFAAAADESGVLKLVGKPDKGCIDVSGCKSTAGSAVHAYNNSVGPCGIRSHSACQGANERWTFDDDGLIHSELNPHLCLRVTSGGGGSLAACDQNDGTQTWVRSNSVQRAGQFMLKTTAHDDQQCLTVMDPPPPSLNGALTLPGMRPDDATINQYFPNSQLSMGYKAAYTTSKLLVDQIDRRRRGNEQCKRGFGAPQGPLGEIYSTHTTINVSSTSQESLTTVYVVAVQLATDFVLHEHHIRLRALDASHVAYAYDSLRTFRPSAIDVTPFGGNSTLLLKKSDASQCSTGTEVRTQCFPFHLTAIAPVASNGWVLTGEVGKFMPISNQRIKYIDIVASGGFAVSIKGAPGEAVTMGAYEADAKKIYYGTEVINEDGSAVLRIPSSNNDSID